MQYRSIETTTEPTGEIVSLAEAKAHLRVTHVKDDVMIAAYLAAAVAHVDGLDGVLGRALRAQGLTLTLDAFPCERIRLPLLPFGAVTAITYDTETETDVELDAADYRVHRDHGFGVILPGYNKTFPSDARNVRVEYTAGPARQIILDAVKAPILLIVGGLYDVRAELVEGRIISTNPAVTNLLTPLIARSWE